MNGGTVALRVLFWLFSHDTARYLLLGRGFQGGRLT
jgi:hypothetical protein